MHDEPPPLVPQAQIDEAEQMARRVGLTYLSVEGYAKLALLIAEVRRAYEQPPILQSYEGWRVG